MGGELERWFIPALVGLAPAILALLTWGPYGLSPVQAIVLMDAAPVLVVELFVFVVALREGLLPWVRRRVPVMAFGAIMLWLIVTVATTFFAAPDQISAIRWTFHWIVHLCFGFSIAFLCRRSLRARDLVHFYLAGFLLYAVIFFAYALRYWAAPIDWVHHLPAAIHIRHVGIYAAAMTGMSVGVMAASRDWRGWVLGFLIATIGFAIGLWTGSRGMALSVGAATVLGIIVVPEMRRADAWAGAGLSLLLALLAVAWLPAPNGSMMGVARTVAATTEHEMTTGRTQIWVNVIHAIGRQPLFGYGPAQMSVVAPYYGMAQPHNLILQILLDWGVVGFVCVAVLAFFYVRWALPALRREGGLLAPPFVAMASILALSMIDAAMYHVMPVSIFAACAGMVAANWAEDTHQSKHVGMNRDA